MVKSTTNHCGVSIIDFNRPENYKRLKWQGRTVLTDLAIFFDLCVCKISLSDACY